MLSLRLGFTGRVVTAMATCMVSLMVAAPASAKTLLESADTLYSLNLLGFFHLDVGEHLDGADQQNGPPIDTGLQQARMVGHFTSQLGPRISAFMEVEGTATEESNKLRLERIMLKYDIDNDSQIAVGRFHAPVGFWNQHYHHGRWLQTTKDRPLQTDFGGKFLPGHYWGGMYERRFSLSSHTLELDLGFGAGRDSNFSAPALAARVQSDIGFTAQLNLVPPKQLGLGFGGSLWLGDLEAAGRSIDEHILTGHIRYRMSVATLLAELAWVEHDYAGAPGKQQNHAGYIEYNRRLDLLQGRVNPYVRLEYTKIDEDDPVFSGLRSRERRTLGSRYELGAFSAIKLEIRQDRFRNDSQTLTSVQAQYASVFWW